MQLDSIQQRVLSEIIAHMQRTVHNPPTGQYADARLLDRINNWITQLHTVELDSPNTANEPTADRDVPEVEDGGDIAPYRYGSQSAPISNGG